MTTEPDPPVCGDVLWCGLEAGHDQFVEVGLTDGTYRVLDHAITDEGVYDLPAVTYHADPVAGMSLTASGIAKLRPPGCPAKYVWLREHGEPPNPSTDAGSLAHAVLFGAGTELDVIPTNPNSGRWDTNALKAEVAAARDAGRLPVKPDQVKDAEAMAGAVRDHPTAAGLLTIGDHERTIVWRDPATGVMCRAMLDVLPPAVDGVMHLADYKTTDAADSESIERAIDRYRYHVKMAFRREGILALGLATEVRPFLVFQEREEPWLIHTVELDRRAMDVGAYEVRRALERYAECDRNGRWPGYDDDQPTLLGLPIWTERRYEDVI